MSLHSSVLASLTVQAQPDSDLPYVPRQDDSEGIGSYARKIAQAGLDLSANPRDVVYYHPMVSMAGLLPIPYTKHGLMTSVSTWLSAQAQGDGACLMLYVVQNNDLFTWVS